MKNLVFKEFKLFVIPLVYLFMAFFLMLLIPNYPYTVSFFYTCLGIFFCMQTGRENKDIQFMLMLPITKREIVKARYFTVFLIELIQLLLCIPVSVLRKGLLNYPNLAGIEADVAFYGVGFLIFAVFNRVYFGQYFQDVSRVGIAFLKAATAVFAVMILGEASVHIGKAVLGSCFWDSMDSADLQRQIPILLAGIVVYGITLMTGYRRDVRHFEKQDF